MHASRFLTKYTSNNSKMPCYSLPCWVISWPDEVHHLFPCSHQNPRMTNRNLQHWTITNWMAEVKCHSEPGLNYERHQDILPWNPLSFLIQNIKNVVCRFSLVSQWTPLTVQLRKQNPVCILILIMYFCYQSIVSCNTTLTDEGNENGEKTTIGLISIKATLHVQHTFCTFFCRCFARLQREKLPESS